MGLSWTSGSVVGPYCTKVVDEDDATVAGYVCFFPTGDRGVQCG